MDFWDIPWGLLIPLLLLLGTYFIGNALERRHYRSIQAREAEQRGFPTITFQTLPQGWEVTACEVTKGSVVISVDYFKRFLAGLKALFGGRITSYEPLLDRARREALLRMIEEARSKGYDAVINVRLETSRLANTSSKRDSTAGVEMLAFGTAIKLATPLPSS